MSRHKSYSSPVSDVLHNDLHDPLLADEIGKETTLNPSTHDVRAGAKSRSEPANCSCDTLQGRLAGYGEKYLSDAKVADKFDVSRKTIWEWVKTEAGFPKPVKITSGTTRWKLSEIQEFERQRERAPARNTSSRLKEGSQ